MSITALLSSPLSHLPTPSRHSPSPPHFHLIHKPYLSHTRHKTPFLGLSAKAQNDGAVSAVTVEDNLPEKKVPESPSPAPTTPASEAAVSQNGSPGATPEDCVAKFKEPRWVGGTWDLKQFQKDGKTNWDAVIDAEVRRRKWLEENPEASSNYDPVVFDTSIIPWWAWMKRFHLPEAEKLNGRAAMIGFFMAYLVDSLTGLGIVDQMGNVVCKTLLFVAVAGVLLIRKNEDIETLKKLVEETTFYDKQWQASWKDDTTESVKNE